MLANGEYEGTGGENIIVDGSTMIFTNKEHSYNEDYSYSITGFFKKTCHLESSFTGCVNDWPIEIFSNGFFLGKKRIRYTKI